MVWVYKTRGRKICESYCAMLGLIALGGMLLDAGYTVESTPENQAGEIEAGVVIVITGIIILIIYSAYIAYEESQRKNKKIQKKELNFPKMNFEDMQNEMRKHATFSSVSGSSSSGDAFFNLLSELVRNPVNQDKTVEQIIELDSMRTVLGIQNDSTLHAILTIDLGQGKMFTWDQVRNNKMNDFVLLCGMGQIRLSLTRS